MSRSMKGKYNHNIDAKGRLIIPAKLREQLGREFVITRGLDGNLSAYSTEEWEKFAENLNNLGNNKADARKIRMFFFENAFDVEVDGTGRALIPQELREAAKIQKEVVIVGNMNNADIWSKELYDKIHEQEEFSLEYIKDLVEKSDFNF